MRIALIDPRTFSLPEESFPSLGLGYLAAVAAQAGHEVQIFDLRVGDTAGKRRYLKEGFDLVGLTTTSFTFSDALRVAREIKAAHPGSRLLFGGPHTTIAGEEVLVEGAVDFAVFGEGEVTFRELLAALETGDENGLAAIPGLMLPRSGKKAQGPSRPWIEDLDALPLPDFSSLDMGAYTKYPIITSRGCPFQCVYCCCGPLWGKKWRYRSPESLNHEIRTAVDRYGWAGKPFNILDDTFNLNPERVEAFCDRLIADKLDLQYHVWGFRADRAPMRMLEKLKASGCLSVSIGVESASPNVLKQMRKGETIDQITETLGNLKKVGIYPMCLFMIGNPGDTLETVKQTIRYAADNRLYLVTFNMALPYPKTELWDYVEANGRFLRRDYTEFHHYSEVPLFETPDFSAEDRSTAFKLARAFERKQRIRFEIFRKVDFIRRGDFRALSRERVQNAVRRLFKYSLDLVFGRVSKEKF